MIQHTGTHRSNRFAKGFPLMGFLLPARNSMPSAAESENLYHRVRALFFLYAIHRFHLPPLLSGKPAGSIPFAGYEHLLQRRFEEAIDEFIDAQTAQGSGDALSSSLASAFHSLAFQTLADQVRSSVRSVDGNRWMFRMGHPSDHPLRFPEESY